MTTADDGLRSLIRAASGGDHPPRGFLTRFAERVGTSTSTVSRWRAGTVPDAIWWPQLAAALDLSEAEVQATATAATRSPDSMAELRARVEQFEQQLAALSGQVNVIRVTLDELRAVARARKRS